MHPIDISAYSNRWGRYHPGQKVLLACGMLFLALILPPFFAGPVILAGMTGLALFAARVPAGVYLRYLLLGAGFATVGAVPLLFSVGMDADSGGVAVSFSAEGTWTAARVLLRAISCTACLLFLAATTPLADLVAQLRRVGVPGAVVEIMQLIYRMLWLLDAESRQIMVAQSSRMGYSGLRQSFRSTCMLGSGLFLRVMNRAGRMERGLAARGYDGALNVLLEKRSLSAPAVILILAVQVSLALISIYVTGVFPWLK